MVINCKTLLDAYTVNSIYASKCMLIDDVCKSVTEQIEYENELLLFKYKSHKISMMYENYLHFLRCKTIITMRQFLNEFAVRLK